MRTAAENSGGRVDLVLEGGGVKGTGRAGAAAVLEQHGSTAQNVADTSAGTLTAALIAAGYSAAELKEIVLSLDFQRKQHDELAENRAAGRQGRSATSAKGIGDPL